MEISVSELRQLQCDRDQLVSEIATLRAKPESGTYAELAQRVAENTISFTPDQKNQIRDLILNRGFKQRCWATVARRP